MLDGLDVESLQAVRRTFSGTAQWYARSQFFRIKILSPPRTVLCQSLIGKLSKQIV
jgi:hypothetical protein